MMILRFGGRAPCSNVATNESSDCADSDPRSFSSSSLRSMVLKIFPGMPELKHAETGGCLGAPK